jgi:hypothetical protein
VPFGSVVSQLRFAAPSDAVLATRVRYFYLSMSRRYVIDITVGCSSEIGVYVLSCV